MVKLEMLRKKKQMLFIFVDKDDMDETFNDSIVYNNSMFITNNLDNKTLS
jgi:hypothetical protein